MLTHEYAPESEVSYEAQESAQVLSVPVIIEQGAKAESVKYNSDLILFDVEEDDSMVFYNYCSDTQFDVVHVYVYKETQAVRIVFNVDTDKEVQHFSCLDAFACKDA